MSVHFVSLQGCSRGAYPERPDVRWRNREINAWTAAQPQPCDDDAKKAKRDEKEIEKLRDQLEKSKKAAVEESD